MRCRGTETFLVPLAHHSLNYSSCRSSCELNAFAHGQQALQGKAGNLIFSHECDARMRLSVDDELFEHSGTRGSPRDAIVRANRHHATPRSGLGIERVELRLEIVRIHGRAEVASFIIHDVIHVERVGNDGKWFVAHVNQERLVAAYIVNVIDEAERLKNSQGMRSTAQPESVETDWPRPGRSLDALDTLLIGGSLFFRSHGKLRGPGLPVSGSFMPALDDLFCERRVQVHGRADHMGSNLDLATIKDLEESRQTLFIAVVVPFARRQIWIFRIDLRHRALGSAGRLCATLHLHGNGEK